MNKKRIILIAAIMALVIAVTLWANGYNIILAVNHIKTPVVLDYESYSDRASDGTGSMVILHDFNSDTLFRFVKNEWGFWSKQAACENEISYSKFSSTSPGDQAPRKFDEGWSAYMGEEMHRYFYGNDATKEFDMTVEDFPPGYAVEFWQLGSEYFIHTVTFNKDNSLRFEDLKDHLM
ncbi:hypothetical protein FACS1894217_10260 [Clostridia bacterium]|nr:hypothetical protein FACS1894217_10260 [Clostridia bacterium]